MEIQAHTQAWHGLDDLRPLLRNYLARRCRDESETDDVVQETLLRAARYRAGLTNTARLHAWILQIARNVLRDHVRREGRLPRSEVCDETLELMEGREVGPGEMPDDLQLVVGGEVIEAEIALRHLHGALRQLRLEDRAVLHSFYSGDGSSSQTARACEIAPGLVKVRLFRARKRLLRAMLHGLAARRRAAASGLSPVTSGASVKREWESKGEITAGCEVHAARRRVQERRSSAVGG